MVALFDLQSEKNKKQINKLKKETKTKIGTNSSITRDNLTLILKSNDFYIERTIFSKVEKIF